MKAKILNKEGKEAGEVELPEIFSSKIREDISQKVFEAFKKQQPYAPFFMAGKQHSASGKLRHARRLWKTAYGKGISRVPRKVLWRRGTQFYWIGAEISSTRGGRRAHPPRVEHFLKELKINKKEKLLAINSVISATANSFYLKKRYSRLKEVNKNLPFVIGSDLLKLKTKEFFLAQEKILNGLYELAKKDKKQAGLLLVIGKNEKFKTKLIDVKKTNELEIKDLYPLGRLVVYSEQAIKELGQVRGTEK